MHTNAPSPNEELLQLCDDFVRSERASAETLDALRAFVTSEPRDVIKPTHTFEFDEIDERKELGRTIQAAVETREQLVKVVRPVFWSLVMTTPLAQLRSYASSIVKPEMVLAIDWMRTRAEFMLKTFLAKEPAQTDPPPYPSQNADEADRCRQRDGACVVSGSGTPVVCHIIPFSVTRRKVRFANAIDVVIGTFWGPERASRIRELVSDDSIIDSVSNMICLESQLHRWWSLGYLAFEPLEKLANGTRVRLRWLPRTGLSVAQSTDLDTDPRDHLHMPLDTGVIGMRDLRTGHPLVDGSVFDLTSENRDTEVSYELLALQWDILRMAALCGAAEAADDPSWDPEAEDPVYEAELLIQELDEEQEAAGSDERWSGMPD